VANVDGAKDEGAKDGVATDDGPSDGETALGGPAGDCCVI
jgi:hypothetical protein